MAGTKYTVHVNGEPTDTRSEKAAAVKLAEAVTRKGARVTVLTQAGTEVFSKKNPGRIVRFRTPAFTKVTPAPDVEPVAPDGYVIAYRRPRNHTFLARAKDLANTEPELRYAAVRDSGEVIGYTETTRQGGQLLALTV